MSAAIDVNLLIYASDQECEHHAAAREFLAARVGGRELLCLAWITAMSYLRIVTHGGILRSPLRPDEALGNLRALCSLPHVRTLSEREGFLEAYAEATAGEPLRGRLVPDAHLATILFQHGIRTLYTNDGDFKRFPFLDVRNPLAA